MGSSKSKNSSFESVSNGLSRSQSSPFTLEITCLSLKDLPIPLAISNGLVSQAIASLTVPSFKVTLTGTLSLAAIAASCLALICSKILILWSMKAGLGFNSKGLFTESSDPFFSAFLDFLSSTESAWTFFSISAMVSKIKLLSKLYHKFPLFNEKSPEESSVPPVDSLEYGQVNHNNDELVELRGEGRYFGVSDPELSQPVCSNCHRRGHIRVNCKVVVCHACGKVDDHYETQCPNSMVCTNCGERGHFRNQCKQRRKFNFCTDCNSKTHSADRCPNIWRSYITLPQNKAHKFKYPADLIYCYNCAERGHYGDECLQQRVSKTPNINGSAFTGENLPRELRRQYHSSLPKKRRPLFDEYKQDKHRDKKPKKHDKQDNQEKNSKFSGKPKNANRIPLQPRKSGMLPQKPSGLPAPSRSGFVGKRKRHEWRDKRK
ncbi:hypothetical protein OGAPHI_007224 [Ogataea philodendri]|uniref:CCHC-type domain-containing protein n=1 Tax=Ogataea philodendri TaxID=1378263 RepID=A0A9P8SZE7_9ASCO|nr:uncharacterized protein OGAPHI_007224 [Ogataea philodendri]KAH3660019.1 hypothetical protein OGAPHI_007224 [Ogataea philodendri]